MLVVAITAHPTLSRDKQREKQQMTSEAILGDRPAAAECRKVFAKDADLCIQYGAERLAKLYAKKCQTSPLQPSAGNVITLLHCAQRAVRYIPDEQTNQHGATAFMFSLIIGLSFALPQAPRPDRTDAFPILGYPPSAAGSLATAKSSYLRPAACRSFRSCL